jgi:hypothetical protein
MKSKPKKTKAHSTKGASGKSRAKLGVTTETERKAPVRLGDIDSGNKTAVDL